MLEAILQVRPKDDMTVEEDDRRIINQCKTMNFLSMFEVVLILSILLSHRFYSSSNNSLTEKDGSNGTCINYNITPMISNKYGLLFKTIKQY